MAPPHEKSLAWPFCPHRDSVSVAIVEMDVAIFDWVAREGLTEKVTCVKI